MPWQPVSAARAKLSTALVPGHTVFTRGAAAAVRALTAGQDNTLTSGKLSYP
ncbi:MAG: hypothetical protein ABSB31_08335 [Dehalococcoidia bacterium]